MTVDAVLQWERKGWVVRYPDRSIDLQATAARVDANRDPSRGGAGGGPGAGGTPNYSAAVGATSLDTSTPAGAAAAAAIAAPPPPDDNPSFMECKRRREYWLGRKARLDVEVALRELLPAAEVRGLWFDCVRTVRDRLLALPRRIAAAAVMAAGDERAIERAADDEIVRALASLSEEAPGTDPGKGEI